VFDMAFHSDGQPTQARDIARRQEIPLRYLEQIFGELRRARLVHAKRGPRGGYSLARTPADISLGDVIRAVQGPITLVDPVETAEVGRSKVVPGSIWRELGQKVSACFDAVTIADVCKRGDDLGILRSGVAPMYFI